MKKTIFCLMVFILVILTSKTFAAGREEPHNEDQNFYKSCKNIDQKTYKIIFGSYGKDKNAIYYGCDKMNVQDPKTFEVIKDLDSSYFAKDKYNIYQGKDVLGADVSSFKFLGSSRVAVDKNHLYCRGNWQIFDGFDGNNAKIVDSGDTTYITDNNKLFITPDAICMPLTGVDVKSRQTIEYSAESLYSKDKNHIFYDGNFLPDADLDTWSIYNSSSNYSKDKSHIYYKSDILSDYNPKDSDIYNANYRLDILYYKGQLKKYMLLH